jgi:hypothetical protein
MHAAASQEVQQRRCLARNVLQPRVPGQREEPGWDERQQEQSGGPRPEAARR